MDAPSGLVFYALFGVVGLCLGSFATALIYRIPRDISWIYDRKDAATGQASRSACTACGATLAVRDLVPLFSWLLAGGKCRHCGALVSARYPLTELATMLAVLLQFHAWGLEMVFLPVLLAVPFMIVAVVVDWEHMILPDDTNIALTVLAIFFVALRFQAGETDLIDPIVGAIMLTFTLWLVSFVLSKWKGRPALGHGDLKFLPAAGLFLGVQALPTYMALSGVLGLATAVLKANADGQQAFPFGPALIISLYFHVFLTGLGFDYKW